MVALRRRSKTLSPEWLHFAEQVVANACILDDKTHSLLVEAFSGVARDGFVIESAKRHAFYDRELPALHGQICAKPSWIARVLGLVGIAPGMRILEIGGGCGYASAVMAQAGAYVFSVEDIALVAQRTRKHLDSLYLHNVILRHGDALAGWPEQAPFDAIVSWKILAQVEQNILSQLVTPAGRLVTRIGIQENSSSELESSTNDGACMLTLWETRECGSVFYQLEQC